MFHADSNSSEGTVIVTKILKRLLAGRKIDLLKWFSMKNYQSNIGGFRSNKQDGIFLCKKYTRNQQKAENSFIKTRS